MPNFIDLRQSASSFHALNGRDLEKTHLFSLKAVLAQNPGMRELLLCAGARSEVAAVGTGAFLPELLSKQLHRCPVLLLQSPSLSEEAVIQLPGSHPTVFLNPTEAATYAKTYIGWLSGPSTLCFEEYELSDVLTGGCDHGLVIITAVSGDTVSIGAFSPAGDFMRMIDEAKTMRLVRAKAEPCAVAAFDNDFEIDFGGSEKRCVGPGGEHAFVMRVQVVNENALFVPTREVVAWDICDDGYDVGTEASEVWKWLDKPEWSGPVAAISRGIEIRSVVPVSCHSFPVLAIYLPTSMHEEGAALADGILFSENHISDDLKSSSSYLMLRGRTHALKMQLSRILNGLLHEVGNTHELILAVRCGNTVWIRYYPADQEWMERVGHAQTVADNYKRHSMFTAEEIAAADARAVERDDAEYNAWLYDDTSLLIPEQTIVDETVSGGRFGIDEHIVLSTRVCQVGPYCMEGRDVMF
jgi:hypothetical protein